VNKTSKVSRAAGPAQAAAMLCQPLVVAEAVAVKQRLLPAVAVPPVGWN
jgi:hypothetical protein